MEKSLDDPGSIPQGGANYVSTADSRGWKLPDVHINTDGKGSFATGNLDSRLSLTGDNQISLSDAAPDPLANHQGDVPTASPFKVRPSDLKSLEKSILSELNSLVDEYPAFKKLIQDTEGWIFLVQTPGALVSSEHSNPTGYTSLSSGYTPDSNRPSFVDPDPESTQKIVDSQNALVRALGDTYQLVGEMAAVLNNAAQNYVYADKVVFGDGTNIDDVGVSASARRGL